MPRHRRQVTDGISASPVNPLLLSSKLKWKISFLLACLSSHCRITTQFLFCPSHQDKVNQRIPSYGFINSCFADAGDICILCLYNLTIWGFIPSCWDIPSLKLAHFHSDAASSSVNISLCIVFKPSSWQLRKRNINATGSDLGPT